MIDDWLAHAGIFIRITNIIPYAEPVQIKIKFYNKNDLNMII
jgi:hypothetical protein